MKKLAMLSGILFLAASFSGCRTIGTIPEVEIKDQKYYTDAGKMGAAWRTTLSRKAGTHTKAEWDVIREGMVCASSQVIKENTANLEKFCYYTEVCTYEDVQQFQKFMDGLERDGKRLRSRRP